ncbi:N-lysine methyltransferase SMYD2-like [Chironomus tepperi]|uniref:N-lysine methyltransferase SMYD2-like n=1 Tax=Chironomus tepperi TaxID=113505 RepID=UPI00391F8686
MSHSDKISIDKSDKLASKHRESGNSYYAQKEWFDALICYNKSITFSNSKKVICLAYANRSAVFFELKRYEDCMKNIQWARENRYPANKMLKLNEREKKCIDLMTKSVKPEDPWSFFKLSYPANEKIPWIANCVEMRTTEKYGRGIYATKDLKAGDVICLEQPFIHCFTNSSVDSNLPDAYYAHCYYCFKTCMLNLIPCIRTNALMFCSPECREIIYSKCLNMETFMCDNVKILAFIMDGFNGKEKFEDFSNNNDIKKLNKTIFDYDFSDAEDPENKEKLTKSFLSLKSINEFKVRNFCLSQNHLSDHTRNHILGIRSINEQRTHFYNGDQTVINSGNSISTFVSLLNHSCIPNVHSFSVDNKVSVIVLKPVKAGEQLFRSYCTHIFHFFDQLELLINYKFKCDCKACTDKNVPKFFPPSIWKIPSTFMSRDDFDEAKDCLKEGNHYINTNTKSPDEINRYMEINYSIIGTLAYYCTFPC